MRIISAGIVLAVLLVVCGVLAIVGAILHLAVIIALIVGLTVGYRLRDRHELARTRDRRVIQGRVEGSANE